MTEEDYEVISLKISWAILSISCFLLTLPAKYLLHLLPWRPQPIWLWPLVPPVVILGLSILGFVMGWIGVRFSQRRSLAKVGMFLNAVVLTIITFMILLWFYIVGSR